MTRLASLTVGTRALEVRRFEIHEGISQPFAIHANVVWSEDAGEIPTVVGHEAVFVVRHPTAVRTYRGIVRRAEFESLEDGAPTLASLDLVPSLWALRETRNHRVFQGQSPLEIARSILVERKIPFASRVTESLHWRRETRLQYGESDLAFFSRLLEEAGVSYWFDASDSELVLSDAPTSATPRVLPYRFGTEARELGCVSNLIAERRVRPGRYTVRDRDFRRPWDQAIEATFIPGEKLSKVEQSLERYHFIRSAFSVEAQADDTPAADDRFAARTDMDAASVLAEQRLRAKRVDAFTVELSATDLSLTPGSTLRVEGHSSPALASPLLVRTSVLRGKPDRIFPLELSLVPANVPYAPTLSTRKPSAFGVEPATVVAPAGEELHVDEFGRVRVHFHWDRRSARDERSFAWVPVSQPWAGAGFGGVNLPRVGQEVLIGFLGGDPDAPVVVGRVFTDLNKVPYKLPLGKSQSGWKSSTVGGGGGFNEIAMEDAVGSQLLGMRAERDLQTRVKRDERRTIGNDRSTTVSRNDARRVGGDQSQAVEGASLKSVRGTVDTIVRGNTSSYVKTNQRLSYGQNVKAFTGGTETVEVDAFKAISVEGSRTIKARFHEYTAGKAAQLSVRGGIAAVKIGGSSITTDGNSVKLASKFIYVRCKRLSNYSIETRIEAKETVTMRGGVLELEGGLVTLNGAGKLASRKYEPAAAFVQNGSATVQIGGPKLPAGAVVNDDGSITIGALTIHGSPEFVSRTLADLGAMSQTAKGKKLLKSLVDPADGRTIDVRDGSYQGSKAEPGFWGWLLGGKTSPTVEYDPTEAGKDLPRDAVLYDNLRQAQRLREGQELDPYWLDEERDYLKERKWPRYRTTADGEFTPFEPEKK